MKHVNSATLMTSVFPVQHFVATDDGCRIAVTQFSQGQEVLLLVHGFGENGYSWSSPPPQLTAAYSVFAIDLRGHGASDWDPARDYRLEKFVSDVRTVIDRLSLHRFALAGHSLGATIALRIASIRPAQVSKLVLVEFSLQQTPDDVLDFTLEQFNAQFRSYDSTLAYHAFLQNQRPLADPEALLRYAMHCVRPSSSAGGYELKCDQAVQHMYDVDECDLLREDHVAMSKLVCPLLLVRGSGSAVVTSAAARKLAEIAPTSELCQVRGAGHAVMLDEPKQFYDALIRFLHRSR